MMAFSPKTGAAVLRYSMAMASARADTLYWEPGSRAAWAAGSPTTPANRTAARPAMQTATRLMRSDPQVRSEDLLLAELVGFAHELHATLVEDVDEVGQFEGPGDV